jgi:hypothetical protein
VPANPLPDLTTEHFTFAWYDEAGPEAEARANLEAVAETAESDLARLGVLFSVPIPADWGPIDVRTNLVSWGGSNGGYEARGLNMSSPPRDHVSPYVADEASRWIFVAELAEIMMSYRDLTVPGAGPWNAGDSAGEGLSRVLADLFHNPDGGNIWIWVQAGGPDFVSTTDPTDTNGVSFGCAVIFLFYLHSQLGYSWEQIIAANGSTLQEKYAALGGEGDGYHAMAALLTAYFGALTNVPWQPENPFPFKSRWGPPTPDYRPPPDLHDYRPDPSPLIRGVDDGLAVLQRVVSSLRAVLRKEEGPW